MEPEVVGDVARLFELAVAAFHSADVKGLGLLRSRVVNAFNLVPLCRDPLEGFQPLGWNGLPFRLIQ